MRIQIRKKAAPPPGDGRDPVAPETGWIDLFAEGRAPIIALVLIGDWLVAADTLITATILPGIGRDLSGYAWFGWAAAAFLAGVVVSSAAAAWSSETWGLRRAMMAAGLLFAGACALSATAGAMGWFVLGRALQGVAAGWFAGLGYVAFGTLLPERHLPRAFALATSVWGGATLLGPLLGALFAGAGLWRGAFWFFAVQSAVFAALAWRFIPARRAVAGAPGPPLKTLILLAMGVVSIATGGLMSRLGAGVSMTGLGFAFLLAAVWIDRRGTAGVLPRLTSGALPNLAYVTYFTTAAAGAAFALYGPALLQSHGIRPLVAGGLVAGEALAWTLTALSVSGANEAWRSRLVVLGPIAIVLGVSAQALVMGGRNIAEVAVSGALMGAGYGLSFAFMSQRVIKSLPQAERARGSSAISVVRTTGSAVGSAVAAVAANAAGFSAGVTQDNRVAIATAAFGVLIPFALLGVASSVRLSRHGRAPLRFWGASHVQQ